MKKGITLLKRNNKLLAIFLTAVILIGFGFIMKSDSITKFYIYKGKPFKLNLKSDLLFIKINKNLKSTESFSNLISQFPEISAKSNFDVKDGKGFVTLNSAMDESSIVSLIARLTDKAEIGYASPVFSPDNGKTLIGVEDEIIVQFKNNLNSDRINSLIKEKGLEKVQKLSLTGGESYVLRVSKNSYAIDVANEIYNSGLVNWSEPNLYFTNLTCALPNDPFYPRQWSIRNTGNNIPEGISGVAGCDMRVDSAWTITTGSASVIVAVNDTGCDTLHEDMATQYIPGTGYNFYNNTPGAMDDYGHGTGCAGIIGAIQNNNKGISGISPGSRLIPVKWMNASGSGNYTGATNALIYCYQKGAWVCSNSWGFVGGASSAMDQALADGATLGRNGKGTVFVFAAGNENGAMRFPASTNTKLIVVGGVSPCNQRKSTSSCDGESFWGASYGANMDIVAPCVKIYATDMTSGGFTPTAYDSTFNGTSSATPNTAGVAALILAIDSSLTWDSVRVRIDRTADKVGTYTYDQPGPRNIGLFNNEMGYGKVNAYKVLKLTLQMMGPVVTHTPLGNTEQTTGNRTVNCVIIPSNSGLNVSTLKLYYAKNSTSWTAVNLSNSGGTNWTASLPLSGAGIYNYYLTATDSALRTGTAPMGAPANYYSFIASSDTTKPVITHTAIVNQPKQSWPVTVTATVTDNIGVDSVWVRWYKNTTANYKRFKLTNTSGSTYASLFNSVNSDVAPGDTIFYRIIAQDISAGHSRDSTALYKFAITNVVSNNVCRTVWVPIRDNATNYDSFQVGTHSAIIKVNFTMAQLIHTYDGDVTFAIRAPNGTEVTLSANNGSSGDNYTNTIFNDSATTPIASGTAPFTGTFNPTSPLSAFNGLDPYGWWRFKVSDNASGDTGHVSQYCVQIFAGGIITGTNAVGTIIPSTYTLNQNYPNPFNPVTKINFDIPKQGLVSLRIYDILGREVRTLVNEFKAPGSYSVDFNGADLSSGVYFYRLESNGFSDIKRMMLIK